MKIKSIIQLIIISILLCILASCSLYIRTDCNIDNYETICEEVKFARRFLPMLTDLGDYSDISYSHKSSDQFFMEYDAIYLCVEYTEDNYVQKKQEVLSSYDFLDAAIVSTRDELEGYYISPLSEFDYKGYSFLTSVDEDLVIYGSQWSSRSFAFVGYNDEYCRLTYCYFLDEDAEWVLEPTDNPEVAMIKFMDEHFLWNEISD